MQEITIATDTTIIAAPITANLFTQWINYIDAKPKTVETYNRAIKQFACYMLANGITAPAREDIIAFRDSLKATHKPTTVQSYLQATKLFFQWTAQEGLYPNIAERVKGVKLDSNKAFKKDYLTPAQAKRVITTIDRSTLKGKRDYAMLLLMVTTGLRTVEIARANIEDLRTVADFTALFIQGKGREDKTDYVKVTDIAEAAIRDYLASRGKVTAQEPLFSSIANKNSGERMTTRSVSRVAKEHLVACGLDSERLTAHSLRHTAATLNLLNGATIEETQQLLRHTNINTTLIYSHALERASNKSEDRIANAIFN